MSIEVVKISGEQAEKIRLIDEGQFADVKAIEVAPSELTKHISAFANADGGDLYIGITDKERHWIGFKNMESANNHIQVFENFFPLGTYFKYEFLQADGYDGLVLHAQIDKTQLVTHASNKVPFIRRGAQSLPVATPDRLRQLELSKGIASFETETTNASKEIITESEITSFFIKEVIPTTTPEIWLKKQNLLRQELPTVAGVLIFSDEPQAVIPKHCGVKIYRYKTRDLEGVRDLLAGDPETIEGNLYNQIKNAVKRTQEITESVPVLNEEGFQKISYPVETLHEIVTNAVLHRDYSFKDDIHIRIFDNRIEVQSPGRLPANITPKNILEQRFARNGAIVRILNKFPDAPNKDVGEGLNTAFEKMQSLGLKEPIIKEVDNSVLVIIRHELLASPEQTILEYLGQFETIKNGKAREITGVKTDFKMKSIFNKMLQAGQIEKVEGTNTSSTAWRIKAKPEGQQSSLF